MSDINYICCQWRDAITDPPDGTICCVLRGGLGQGSTPAVYLLGEGWIRCDRPQMMPVEEGDQWLDVTDTPAVAVARVQAAVDSIKAGLAKCGCGHGECLTCYLRMDHGEVIDDVVSDTLGRIRHFTGVTPSEVQ